MLFTVTWSERSGEVESLGLYRLKLEIKSENVAKMQEHSTENSSCDWFQSARGRLCFASNERSMIVAL